MMSTKWCPKLDVHKQVTKSMFTARPIELVHSVGMNPDCIVHWTLVWTVHSEDDFRRSQSATTTRPCFGPSVRRLWDPRTESCLNFISNCHFTFRRMRIFVRGAVIACWPHSRFWVKDSHSKLADSFDESLDLSDWLKIRWFILLLFIRARKLGFRLSFPSFLSSKKRNQPISQNVYFFDSINPFR